MSHPGKNLLMTFPVTTAMVPDTDVLQWSVLGLSKKPRAIAECQEKECQAMWGRRKVLGQVGSETGWDKLPSEGSHILCLFLWVPLSWPPQKPEATTACRRGCWSGVWAQDTQPQLSS